MVGQHHVHRTKARGQHRFHIVVGIVPLAGRINAVGVAGRRVIDQAVANPDAN